MAFGRFKRRDVPELVSWVETEAEMVQWTGSVFTWPLTENQFRQHLEAADMRPPTLYAFGLYERSRIIGYCELSQHRRQACSAMLSRVIVCPRRRQRGWGKSMVRQVLAFGFEQLELHRIGLGVFDFNEAAIRCYAEAAFTHEGTLRDSARVGNRYWSCHLMSILCHEWRRDIPPVSPSGRDPDRP